jgi:hypothetical protein
LIVLIAVSLEWEEPAPVALGIDNLPRNNAF